MARLARGGVSGEQLAQGPFYYPPAPQGGVEATPSSPVGGHEAQVDRRRNRAGGGEQGVGQLKERVGSTLEAPVERVSKGAQIVEGLRYGVHNDPSCSQCSPMSTADNDPWPLGLKHKLRACANRRVAYVSRTNQKAVGSLSEMPCAKICLPIGASSKGVFQ